MSETARLLQVVIDQQRSRLLNISATAAAQRPAPGKWSPKEIIGHLIDSASNNHQRFVRAQFKDDLVFDSYQQEEWVQFQDYAAAEWENLVQLWYYFNWQIARVIDLAPETRRLQRRQKHNLDKTAMHKVPADNPATLEYFMYDYVRHLEGHLRQIFPDYEPLTTPQPLP